MPLQISCRKCIPKSNIQLYDKTLCLLDRKDDTRMSLYQRIRELIGGKENLCILELGAHRLEDSFDIVSAANPKGSFRFIAVECDPRNIAAIGTPPKWVELDTRAISNITQDNVTLYQSSGNIDPSKPDWMGSSSILKPTGHLRAFEWCKFSEQAKIKSITLDDFFAEKGIERADFVKSDLQGGEVFMIMGGQNALRKTKYLYFEYYQSEMYKGQKGLDTLFSMLPGNWGVVEVYPNDVLVENLDLK